MGTKFVMKNTNSWLKVGASTYYLTGLTFNEAFDKIEVTDTSTSGDGKEYITGRAERTFSAEVLLNVSASDITIASEAAVTASFEGKTYAGMGIFYTKNVQGSIDDSIKVSYEGSFNGAVVVTAVS